MIQVLEISSVRFVVTGIKGPVGNAVVNIDGINVGSTDSDGNLKVDTSASEEGISHEYLVTAQDLNNSVGSIISISNISITENVIMTKYSPGKGAIIAHVVCEDMPCAGVYPGIEGLVRGVTDAAGSIIIENLIPVVGVPLSFVKPGYSLLNQTVNILENTTTKSPLASLTPAPPNTGIIAFHILDISGPPIAGALATLDSRTLSPSRIRGGTIIDDNFQIGIQYSFSIKKSGYDDVIGSFTFDRYIHDITVIMFPTGTRTIKPESVGTMSFLPTDSEGNPLDLVTIIVDDIYTLIVILTTECTITNFAPGIHTFIAKKEGYEDYSAEINVDTGSTIDFPTMAKFVMKHLK